MTFQIANYLINNFRRLLTSFEKDVLQQFFYRQQLARFEVGSVMHDRMTHRFTKMGQYGKRPELLPVMEQGYTGFVIGIGQRIMTEHRGEYRLNLCTKCGSLARTPYARQCAHCFHHWHDQVTAHFRLKDIFRLSARPKLLYLTGLPTQGSVAIGDIIDFTNYQLPYQLPIRQIESVRVVAEGWPRDLFVLAISASNEEEELLRKYVQGTTNDIYIDRKLTDIG